MLGQETVILTKVRLLTSTQESSLKRKARQKKAFKSCVNLQIEGFKVLLFWSSLQTENNFCKGPQFVSVPGNEVESC